MTDQAHPPPATSWQFALAVLSEWRRTVAVVIIVMLLGWPMMVLKRWSEDAGLLSSIGLAEQSERQAEHTMQMKVLTKGMNALEAQGKSIKAILIELQNHGRSASQDRVMLGYFTWKQCIQDNGKNAQVCERFKDIGDNPHGH